MVWFYLFDLRPGHTSISSHEVLWQNLFILVESPWLLDLLWGQSQFMGILTSSSTLVNSDTRICTVEQAVSTVLTFWGNGGSCHCLLAALHHQYLIYLVWSELLTLLLDVVPAGVEQITPSSYWCLDSSRISQRSCAHLQPEQRSSSAWISEGVQVSLEHDLCTVWDYRCIINFVKMFSC